MAEKTLITLILILVKKRVCDNISGSLKQKNKLRRKQRSFALKMRNRLRRHTESVPRNDVIKDAT